MTTVESELRAKNKANADQVMVIFHLFRAKRETTEKNESILEKNKVSVKAGKMIQEKR